MRDLLLYLGAYLFGSIPMGYFLLEFTKGIDLKKSGDGQVGMAQVWKIAGTQMGLLTLVLDILKGVAAVSLARYISPGDEPDWILAGFLALLGDEFPVFFKFKGTRGIGVSVGVFAALLYWMTHRPSIF